MKNNLTITAPAPNAEAVQARFALRVTAALSHLQDAAPAHDIDARLHFAREQALSRVRQLRRIPATATASAPAVFADGSGTVMLAGGDTSGSPWWLRVGMVLPLVVLLAGLTLIESRYTQSQIEAAVEVDSAILSDDLPPEAYSDTGFVEFLKTARK